MEILCVALLSFIALEGAIVTLMPDFVKKIISEAPRGILIAAGVAESLIALLLYALLVEGKL